MKKKKIVASILCLVAVVCIATGTFLMLNKEEMTATEVLEKAMGNFNSGLKDMSGGFAPFNHMSFDPEKTYNFNVNIAMNSDSTNVNLDTYLNVSNGNYLINAESEEEDISYYIKDNTIYYRQNDEAYRYLTFEEIFGELSGIDEETLGNLDTLLELFNSDSSSLTDSQTEKLENLLKSSILDNISESDFVETDEDLNLGDNTFSTKKYTLKVTDVLVKKIAVSFLENLRKDKELVGAFEDLLKNNPLVSLLLAFESGNSDFEDLSDDSYSTLPMANEETDDSSMLSEIDFDVILGQLIDELNAYETSNQEIINYVMYLDNEEIISYEFSVNVDGQSFSIALNDYENKDGFNNEELVILSSGSELVSLKFNGVSNTKKEIAVSLLGEAAVKGSVETTDNKFELSIDVLGDSSTSIAYLNEVVEQGKEEKYSLSLTTSDSSELKIDGTLKLIGGMPDVDTSNSVHGSLEDLQ